MKIHVITYAHSTNNLSLIERSILTAKADLPIDITWHLLVDKIPNYKSRLNPNYITDNPKYDEIITKNFKINIALDQIHSGYVYVLDADNLMHPLLLKELYQHTAYKGMVVEQVLDDNTLRPIVIKPGSIDASQYVLEKELIGLNRLHLTVLDAGGYLIEEIYDKNPKDIVCINKPLSYIKKAIEYQLLQEAPPHLAENSIVIPNRDYWEKNIKNNPNPILRATITHLSRLCGLKLKIIKILENNVVNVIPLRESHHCYKGGKGILLIFESQADMENCLQRLEWDL